MFLMITLQNTGEREIWAVTLRLDLAVKIWVAVNIRSVWFGLWILL
jgi:hypothetical protein